MEITFVGVGEAFDESLPNTSMVVRTEHQGKPVTLLLDCGYSVPPRFWQLGLHAETLDGIWISHFHADHAFGLPALLVRFWEEKRTRDLHIFGQRGIESYALKCLDLAYPNFYQKIGYSLRFKELEPGQRVTAMGLSWKTAVADHPQRDLALRLESGGKSLFYSGDGRPTPETIVLAEHAELIVHEAYQLSTHAPGHGTLVGCLEMASASRAKKLALVHIQRKVRREKFQEIKKLVDSVHAFEVLIPEPDDRIKI